MTDDLDEEARRRFEAAWLAGASPAIEDHLPAADAPAYLATLEELAHIELELAWRGGDGPRVEQLAARFPALATDAITHRLVETELHARCRFAERPTVAELAARFPRLPDPAAVLARAARRTAPGPGVTLGRYQIRDEHARGAFGRVWAADDRELGRVVAIKQLEVRAAADDGLRRRFLTEAKITARLDHPGIVPVYELRDADGPHPHYAMKLVRGTTLGEAIARLHEVDLPADERARERERLLDAVLAIARTIAFAHDHGVLHRDLKPDNVVLGDFGEVFVLDWGLAKVLGTPDDDEDAGVATRSIERLPADRTHAGLVMGTPAYMAPEQARGDLAIDQRADVYAIGAILFHVLAGVRPYAEHATSEAVLAAVRTVGPTPLAERAPDAPAELRSVVERAMQPEPARRYASAAELVAHLEQYRAGRLVGAHRYRTRDLLARWARRHRGALVTAAAMLVALGVVATLSIGEILHERDRARRNLDEATALVIEDGRRELLAGRPWVAAPLLARAHGLGARDDVTRMLLADAMRAPDALVATLPGIDDVAFAPQGDRLIATAREGRLEVWQLGGAAPARLASTPIPGGRVERPVVRGTWVLTAGDRARLWDVRTGALVRTFDATPVTEASFDATGARVIVSGDGVTLYDVTSGAPIHRFGDGRPVTHAELAGDDRVVAFGADVRIWDVAEGRSIAATDHVVDASTGQVAGSLVAVAAGRHVHVWSARTGAAVSIDAKARRVEQLLLHEEGSLATAGDDGRIVVWDVTGTVLREILVEPRRRRFGVALAAIARRPLAAVARQDGTGAVYDLKAGVLLASIASRGLRGEGLAFAASGAEVVSLNEDGTAAAWDAWTGRLLQSYAAPGSSIEAIRPSPDGTRAITLSRDGNAQLWTTRHRKLRSSLTAEAPRAPLLAPDPTRARLAVGGRGGAIVWDVTEHRVVATLKDPDDPRASIAAIRYAPDGAALVTAWSHGRVDVWDGERLARVASLAPTRPDDRGAALLSFSDDARWLATGFASLDVWSTRSWTRTATLSGHTQLRKIGFSRDGAAAGAQGSDGTIWMWRTRDWRLAQTIPPGGKPTRVHTGVGHYTDLVGPTGGKIVAVAVGKGGTRIATAASDRIARLWDARTGALVGSFSEHDDKVIRLALSRDERLLVTADATGALRVWDTRSGRLLAAPGGHREVGDLVVAVPRPDHEDEGWFASSSADGVVRIWDLRRETRSAAAVQQVLARHAP